MEIAENVFKIHGEGNIYVILGSEPLVIDTGSYTERSNIEARIKEIIDPKEIKHVLLTHLHYDHSGNLDLFPHARIYASKEEIEDYNKNSGWFFFGKIPHELLRFLDKMESLPRELLGLRVEKASGHTKGSVYFVDEKNKLLFSGDTVFHHGVGRTDFENSVPEEMEKSIYKILDELRVGGLKLMPGHDY